MTRGRLLRYTPNNVTALSGMLCKPFIALNLKACLWLFAVPRCLKFDLPLSDHVQESGTLDLTYRKAWRWTRETGCRLSPVPVIRLVMTFVHAIAVRLFLQVTDWAGLGCEQRLGDVKWLDVGGDSISIQVRDKRWPSIGDLPAPERRDPLSRCHATGKPGCKLTRCFPQSTYSYTLRARESIFDITS